MRRLERLAVALVACVACSAFAQLAAEDSGRKETPAPPAPAFSTSHLITLDLGPSQALKFGIDPDTVSLSADGVVRYVVVASSASGATNAMYEGIRCATGEFKTYARATTAGTWNTVEDPQWLSLYANLPSKHALAVAEQGVCNGKAPAGSAQAIIRQLKNPPQYQRAY
ncbi:MAG: CNP1-like family protein [Rhodoferax sp.]|nr:CNP1-like family protein [Rhodoferax sp.]